ncbi:MAG: polyamine aminopropyltransferase [Bdellovibrionota bacterium]
MYFEGSEKKLELSIKQGAKSLKSLPKSFWESVAKVSGAHIVSSVTSPLCDSYLLSDASLFVFPHKFLMIGGSHTRLVSALREFLTHFKMEEVDALFYEYKNEAFPDLKISPFFQDAEELARMVPGQACRLGPETGSHIYLFYMDKASSYLKDSESTLEVAMHGLSAEVKSHFTKGKIVARKWISENPDFKNFFGSFDVLDHGYEPFGYVLNAIKGDRYFTFHVNPDDFFSYASFETNCFDQEIDELVASVKSLFQPKSYEVILFGSEGPMPFNAYVEGEGNYKLETALTSGHFLKFYALQEKQACEVLTKIEIPKFVEKKLVEETPKEEAQDWFFEKNDKYSVGSRVIETFYKEKSELQLVEVHNTEAWGKTLVCNGQIVCADKDEFIYHEMMTHVPMFVHPDPARVLIIGGGDLGVAREVLKHNSLIECVCIEPDAKVIEAAKRHFEWPAQVMADSRFELVIGTLASFMEKSEKQFDVVLVDTYSTSAEPTTLHSEEFYESLKYVLAAGGVIVSQAESPLFNADTQKALRRTLSTVFSKVFIYNYSNATYPGGLWSFAFSSESFHPLDDFDREKATKSQIDFRYYSPELHYASFILPAFMKKNLRDTEAKVEPSAEPATDDVVGVAAEAVDVGV